MNQYNMTFYIDKLKTILTTQKFWVLPLTIFGINILLRIVNIDSPSLWYDEVFSIFHAQPSVDKILLTCKWDINAPMYLIVLHYWGILFGFTSLSARLLSLVFVALSSVILYSFCNKYLNKKTALIASALFLVSNDFFFYSHEARAYTMILFLTLSSAYIFFSLLFEPKLWKIVILGVVNFMIFYTHYLAGLFFVSQVLVSLLYDYHKGFKYYVLSYIVFLGLLAHWIPRVIEIITTRTGVGWLAPPVFGDFINFWINAFYGVTGCILILLIFIYVLFKFNVLVVLKDPRIKKDKIIILIYLFSSSVIIVLINFFLSGIMTPMFLKRYLLFTLPFFFILFSYLLSLVKLKDSLLIVGLSIICLIGLFNIDWNPTKGMDYKSASAYLKKTETPKRVYFTDIEILFAYYHNPDCFYDYEKFKSGLMKNNIYEGSDTTILSLVDFSKYDEVVLLQTFEDSKENEEKILALYDRNFTLKEVNNNFANIRIHIYKNDKKTRDIGQKIDPKYLENGDVASIIFKMLADKTWLEQIKIRAKEINSELDLQLYNEAVWLYNLQNNIGK